MKSLQESLFDTNLANKKIPIIGDKWDYDVSFYVSRTGVNQTYKIFDKKYLKKCKPSEKQMSKHLNNIFDRLRLRYPDNTVVEMYKKVVNMAYVIMTWPETIVNESLETNKWIPIFPNMCSGIVLDDGIYLAASLDNYHNEIMISLMATDFSYSLNFNFKKR